MRNKNPIFLFCLSRGGSNIFWNLFLTHPGVCSPIHETLEIFRIDPRAPTWEGYFAAILSTQPRLFDQWHLQSRRPITNLTKEFIDKTLYRRKLRTFKDQEMRFKYDTQAYTLEEVENARLVTKNNNGLVYLKEMFADIYPEAIFFALVRDPIPLYESHKRRKISKSIEDFAKKYITITGRMIRDAETSNRYHLVRFEDILNDPIGSTKNIYEKADLDFQKIKKMRFRAKPHYRPDGTYGSNYQTYNHHWFDFENVYQIINPDINKYHTRQLSPQETETIRQITQERRSYFDYS